MGNNGNLRLVGADGADIPLTSGFGAAVEALRRGDSARRNNWAEGMRVFYARVAAIESTQDLAMLSPDDVGACAFVQLPSGKVQPGWTPTIGDVMAEDWMVLK